MKKNLILLLVAIVAISCNQKQEESILLTGSVEGVESGTVYLQKFRNKTFDVIDSAEIVNGEFSFAKDVELPEIYGLSLDTTKNSFLLFLDENVANVVLDSVNYYRNTTVEGSELHNLYVEYRSDRDTEIDAFIRKHPSSLVSAYALYRDYSYRLTPDEIRSNIELLDPSLRNTPYVETLEELNALYQQQIQEDEHFAGEMADAYRLMMQELYKEHQKIIHFYKALNKNINEFDLDYEDETNYLNKIVDLL